jgi:hypothetical protein
MKSAEYDENAQKDDVFVLFDGNIGLALGEQKICDRRVSSRQLTPKAAARSRAGQETQ